MAVSKQPKEQAQASLTSKVKAPTVQRATTPEGAIPASLSEPAGASPQEILQLQRVVGNRAVQRLTQKANTAPPVGLKGGPAPASVQSQIESAKGGGQAVDKSVSQHVGAALGADVSGARVHTDARADSINRSLGARAATVGNDIFFSEGAYNPNTGAGQQLLAHELTHVVQQGGAVRRKPGQLPVSSGRPQVQRFVELGDFRDSTNKGALRRRGDILNSIDSYLKQYKLYPQLVQNEKDRRERLRLLNRIITTTEHWVARHDVYEMFDRVSDKSTAKVNESQTDKDQARQNDITQSSQPNAQPKTRQGKYSQIIGYLENTFIPQIQGEINTITTVHTVEAMNSRAPTPVKTAEQIAQEKKQNKKLVKQRRENRANYAKLAEKFNKKPLTTGKLFGTVIPTILSLMAPGPGDLGKFTFEVQVPLEAANVPWFVGGKIYLEGERKEANEFKAKFKASFKTGPRFAHASLYGEVGAQAEAQAQTPAEVSNLFNYALYRRFRESSVVPRGVTSTMWGGRKNTLGYQRAEQWAGEVEQDIFGTDDNAKKAYVDMGGYGGVGGGIEFSDDFKGTAAAERYKGRRYTKHTIEKAKGGLGKTQFTKRGKQASLGQGSRRYEFGGAVSASLGIGGSGDFKLKIDQVKAVADPNGKQNYKGHYKTQKAELEINVMVLVPAGGDLLERVVIPLGVKAASAIRDGVQLAKNKETKGEMGFGMGLDSLEEAAGSFERNIEINQKAGSGFLGDTGHMDSSGHLAPSDAVAGMGKSAGTGSGAKMRVKITREHELDLSSAKWKLQGDLYSVNKLGASFAGNKILLDKSTRLGLLKWETGGKMKVELLGLAWTREANKNKNNKMEWGFERELKRPKKRQKP